MQIYLEARRMGVDPGPTLEQAWNAFYEAADPIVQAASSSGRKDPEARADGAQEAWREILTSLPSYRHDPARGRLCDWIFIIARRTCARARKRRHAAPFEPLLLEEEDGLQARESSPWACLEREEHRERIRRGFVAFRGQVGRLEFLAALLHWAGGRTRAEVAALLGLTSGQAHGYFARSAPKLRAAMGEEP